MRVLAMLLLSALSARAATFYLTVAGLGGDPEYAQRFEGWAKEIDRILKAKGNANVRTLSGAGATQDAVRANLSAIAREARADDALVVMLIGHGTFDGADYKFNLPGPDITARELAHLLDEVPAGRQLVVNMTSASGASLSVLARKNRAVITATKTGTQKNATIFPRYWVEALRDPAADVDKNETVTALEAFRYADEKTKAFYESQKRLATEQALFDDTGTGKGVRAPAPDNGEGVLASSLVILRFDGAQAASNDPAKRKLLARKEELESQIDRLKYGKAAMPADEYRRQLSVLLLELAKTQEQLEK